MELPEWFHGPLTRAEAEERLATKMEVGTFLVRSSHRQTGFVLSMLSDTLVPHHYQIKQLVDSQAREYLTFDTETSSGPRFQSLGGVLNYIMNVRCQKENHSHHCQNKKKQKNGESYCTRRE